MILANARRHGRDLTVVVADTDTFKALNDQLGHSAGDRALIAFPEYVEAATRPGDTLGRMGGELGRASRREGGWQYVVTSVSAVSLKKTPNYSRAHRGLN